MGKDFTIALPVALSLCLSTVSPYASKLLAYKIDVNRRAGWKLPKNLRCSTFLFCLNNEANLLIKLCLLFVSRISVLASICMTQAFMMWKFINFQLRRWREHSSSQPQSVKKKFVSAKGKASRKERGL